MTARVPSVTYSLFFFSNALAFSWIEQVAAPNAIARYALLLASLPAVASFSRNISGWQWSVALLLLTYIALAAVAITNEESAAFTLLLCLIWVFVLSSRLDARSVFRCYTIGTLPVVFVGLVGSILGATGFVLDRGGLGAFRGLIETNNLASAFALPLVFAPLINGRNRGAYLTCAIGLASVLAGRGRASILAIIVVMLILALRSRTARKLVLTAGTALGFSIFMAPSFFGTYILQIGSATTVTSGRLDLWRAALGLIAEDPLIGSGLGSAAERSTSAVSGGTLNTVFGGLGFHNTFLNAAVEGGLLAGLVLFLAVSVVLVGRWTSCGPVLLALITVATFESTLGLPGSPHFVFFWALAFAAASESAPTNDSLKHTKSLQDSGFNVYADLDTSRRLVPGLQAPRPSLGRLGP